MADQFYARYPVVGGTSDVTSLNGLTGALTLIAGTGISITPAGSNITISNTQSAGANTSLSNLSAVAINTTLLPGTAGTVEIGSSSKYMLRMYARNYQSFNSSGVLQGQFYGDGLTTPSGGITGINVINDPATTINMGLFTQTTTTVGSGSVFVETGNQAGVGFDSGSLRLKTGDNTVSGNSNFSGLISIATGNNVGLGGTGSTVISTGSVSNVSSTSTTGAVALSSGNNAGTSPTGSVTGTTGDNTGSGGSGQAFLRTGNTESGASGSIDLTSGSVIGVGAASDSGEIDIISGSITDATSTGNTGIISIDTGDNAGSGPSGDIIINSGNTTAAGGTGVRGDLAINVNVIEIPLTVTTTGTTGAQTINSMSGTVNFAAATSSLVVTNSMCTTTSIVFAICRTNDTTAIVKNVVPANGSFTIHLSVVATAETSVGFWVINKNINA
jgi:hypothetical protein